MNTLNWYHSEIIPETNHITTHWWKSPLPPATLTFFPRYRSFLWCVIMHIVQYGWKVQDPAQMGQSSPAWCTKRSAALGGMTKQISLRTRGNLIMMVLGLISEFAQYAGWWMFIKTLSRSLEIYLYTLICTIFCGCKSSVILPSWRHHCHCLLDPVR